MNYFADIVFDSFNHVPVCKAWIDRLFPFYAINYASEGHLYWIDSHDRQVRLDSPVFYWTIPGRRYRYGCLDSYSWDQRWIAFYGPGADRICAQGLLPPEIDSPFVRVTDPERAVREFDCLLRYLTDDMPQGAARAVVMLESLLLQLHEQRPTVLQHRAYAEAMHRLGEAILANPARSWDFEAESSLLFMSYSHFRKLFRNEFDIAPHHFVLRARLKRAAENLRSGTMNVKLSARDAGFDDIFYFTRRFKKMFGEPPAKYARKFILK